MQCLNSIDRDISHPLWVLIFVECYISGRNVVQENEPGVGGYGGTCRCPDGTKYEVGDNRDDCHSFACINGEMITPTDQCNRHVGDWSYRQVTCAGIT